MTTKEKLLARRKRVNIIAVPMPELGEGDVIHVREMTAAERDHYEARQVDRNKTGRGLDNFRSRLVLATACNADGTPYFADDDLQAVGELPASDVRKLFDSAAKLNGMTPEEEKEIEKNS